MTPNVTNFLAELSRRDGIATPSDLRRQLRISAPTLSKLVREAKENVYRMGRARAIRYARTRSIAGLGNRLPVLRVSESGEPSRAGTIHLLWGGRHYWERHQGGTLFTGLPPPLVDMAPQGYLGQVFPTRFPELGLPARVADWSDDQQLIALARRGEDCVGDLIVGDESFARFVKWSPTLVTQKNYPELAQRVARELVGSSAGGERPKFGVLSGGKHLLVKFASGESSSVARRWRDLLWCEWRALELVARAHVPAPRANIVDVNGWRFLEVERFDRVGERGRRSVITLAAIDNEYFGNPDNWTTAASRLSGAPFSLSAADQRNLRWLDVFGQLIGNTDRHFGNVAFFVASNDSLRLAPVYDVCPMILAPANDVLVERTFEPIGPTAVTLDVWLNAADWARVYWREVEANSDLQSEVRSFAGQALGLIEKLSLRLSPSLNDSPNP